MVKFVILTEIRTGYKWLANSICSHPDAFCFGEIFGSDEKVRQQSMFEKPLIAIKENEDPKDWLKSTVEKWGQNKKALGFKVNYVDGRRINGQPGFNKWASLWKYIIDDYKIIHLTRENLLDRALSELLASKESNWANEDYKLKLNVDPNHLLKIMHRSELWQKEARTMFGEMFEVTYEQMSNPECISNIQRYLGLTPQTLTTNQKKQRKHPQSHYIENYNEIYRMLKIHFPCYSHMLDDPIMLLA